MLATTQLNGICSMWDIQTLQLKQQLIAHDGQVNAINFTSDSNMFVTGGSDG
jgi:WD40 repeat protein